MPGVDRHLSPVLGGILATIGVTLILAVALAPELPASPPRPPQATPSESRRFVPPPSALASLTLEGVEKQLASRDRKTAIARLLRAGRADAPKLHEWLHRRSRWSPGDYKNILRRIGAQVPDRHGRFPDAAAKKNVDWLKELLALDPAQLAPGLRDAYPDTLLTVGLMRALAATGHPDASVSLLRFAYRHNSAFKDECGRQIRAMGVRAVPGLLRARALRDPLAYKMVRYAAYQLDRIDCVRPDRALKQADPDLRAEILHAYGEVRDPGAVRAVLRHTDAVSSRVRRAARWATLRYVSGRPPEAVKRKLKLPGGKQTTQARSLYLTYRQLATHALIDRLAQEVHRDDHRPVEEIQRSLRDEVEPRRLAERLFELLDSRRTRSHRAALAAALEQARGGKLAQALKEFDRQLAMDPYHPQRQELAAFYYRRGRQLLESGRPRPALALLTKSLHLAPHGAFVRDARRSRAKAERALPARGPAAEARGATPRDRSVWLVAGVACGLVLLLAFSLNVLRHRFTI